jgi:uncharacterized membrane protein YagU involved in acid resistance
MTSSVRISWPALACQAVAAGIVAGLAIDLYLWLTVLLPAHGTIASMWRWIASTAFGKGALREPGFAIVGLAMHAIVSIGWAGGYAYLAATQPALNRRWVVSGLVYGLVVYVIMQCILLADDNFTYPPSPNAFINALVAHCVFFGLVVAYAVRTMQARSQTA